MPHKNDYKCQECGEITQYTRRAFARATKPKCLACGCGRLDPLMPIENELRHNSYVMPCGDHKGLSLKVLNTNELSGIRGAYLNIPGEPARTIVRNVNAVLLIRGVKISNPRKTKAKQQAKKRKGSPYKQKCAEVQKLKKEIRQLKKQLEAANAK